MEYFPSVTSFLLSNARLIHCC